MEQGGLLRAVFWAAIVAGATYMLAGPLGIVGPVSVIWKGAGVSLLALWCALQARNGDGWLIAAVMALGAAGDVLLEVAGLTVGAVAFLAGHGVAIGLYARNRRATTAPSQLALAVVFALATPFIAWILTRDAGVALYSTGLGIMAAMAWTSRFSRYRTGIGAVMFVASDLLIFARMGPLAGSMIPHLLIWPLYFGGQVLIAWGVVTRMTAERGSSA